MIFINKKVMNIRRILISEQEKKQILSLYKPNVQNINEGLNSDGTYNTEAPHKVISLTSPTNKNFQFVLEKGTYVYKKDDNMICISDSCEYYLLCKPYAEGRYEWIIYDHYGDYYQEDNRDRPLATKLRSLFCKTSTIGGGSKEPPKQFKESQKCKLEGDSKWIYAKDSSGWWASKDGGKTWIKLSLPKFKDAVDKLNSECPQGQGDCKSKCNAKPLEPGKIGSMVQGWFYGSVGCYEATGSGGFSSKEECEACNCSDKIGGQEPDDGNQLDNGNQLDDGDQGFPLG